MQLQCEYSEQDITSEYSEKDIKIENNSELNEVIEIKRKLLFKNLNKKLNKKLRKFKEKLIKNNDTIMKNVSDIGYYRRKAGDTDIHSVLKPSSLLHIPTISDDKIMNIYQRIITRSTDINSVLARTIDSIYIKKQREKNPRFQKAVLTQLKDELKRVQDKLLAQTGSSFDTKQHLLSTPTRQINNSTTSPLRSSLLSPRKLNYYQKISTNSINKYNISTDFPSNEPVLKPIPSISPKQLPKPNFIEDLEEIVNRSKTSP